MSPGDSRVSDNSSTCATNNHTSFICIFFIAANLRIIPEKTKSLPHNLYAEEIIINKVCVYK
jgi:hypothetical protein